MLCRRKYWPLPLLALSLVASACEEATGPGAEDSQVTLSFEVERSNLSLSRSPGLSASSAPVATLKLDTVQLVLAQIKLHRDGDSDDCEKSARCESFRTGPVLVTLPLAGGKITPFATLPPPGRYDALEFKIHRPEGNDSLARVFRAAHPRWPASAAVRVVGTHDGKRFESFFRTEASIKQAFSPVLVIDAATQLNALGLTVSVKVDQWFQDGNGVINPAELTSNHRLLALVEKNIRESFRTRHESGKPGNSGDRERGSDKGKGDEKGKGDDRGKGDDKGDDRGKRDG